MIRERALRAHDISRFSRLSGALLAFAFAFAFAFAWAPGEALADEPPQLLISPLTGELPEPLADVPAEMTEELQRSFMDRGVRAEIAKAPFTDTAAIVGCDPGEAECLDLVASTLNVAKLLYGEVRVGDEPDTIVVRLSLFTRGEPLVEREYTVRGTTSAELVSALTASADGMYEPQPAELAVVPEVPLGPRAGLSGVSPWTWGVFGTGVAAAGVGAILLSQVGSRQDEIDGAPTDSVADFQRLIDLENGGRTRAQVGTGMTIAGGAVALIGLALVLRQATVRLPPEIDEPVIDEPTDEPVIDEPVIDEPPADGTDSPDFVPTQPESGAEPATSRRFTSPARASRLTRAPRVQLVPVPFSGGFGLLLSFEGWP